MTQNFQAPQSIKEALGRKRVLEGDILNIERQLGEHTRTEHGRVLSLGEYRHWRAKAHSSLVYKKTEQSYLKDWIVSRRKEIQTGKLGIYRSGSANDLLQRVLIELTKLEKDEPTKLLALKSVIEMHLKHEA